MSSRSSVRRPGSVSSPPATSRWTRRWSWCRGSARPAPNASSNGSRRPAVKPLRICDTSRDMGRAQVCPGGSSPAKGTTGRYLRLAAALAVAVATTIGPVTSTADARSQSGSAPRAGHVVLVAWDGFDASYLHRGVPTPNLDALAARGSLTTSRGVAPSITNPSWSSVATGAFPERTLNTAYWYDPAADIVRGQSRDIAVETLGQSLRSSGRTLASVQWYIEHDKSVFYGNPAALYTQPD